MHDFDKFHENFDNRFKSVQKTAKIFAGVYLAVVLAVTGGLGWDVYKLVTHFTQ